MTPGEQVRAWVRERAFWDMNETRGTVRQGTVQQGIEPHAIERQALRRRSLEGTAHAGGESQERSAGERSC